jgi:hypothetical protein
MVTSVTGPDRAEGGGIGLLGIRGGFMARVSDETLGDVRRELDRFKNEWRRGDGHYAAAHLAGAVETLLEEAESSIDEPL